jgi:hypothetical protein
MDFAFLRVNILVQSKNINKRKKNVIIRVRQIFTFIYAVNNLRIKNKWLCTGNMRKCKCNRFRQKEKKKNP